MAGLLFSIFLLVMSLVVFAGGSKEDKAFNLWLRRDEIKLEQAHRDIIAEEEY